MAMYFLVLLVLSATVLEMTAASAPEPEGAGPDPKFILYSPEEPEPETEPYSPSSKSKLPAGTQATQVRGTKSASGIEIKGTWPQETVSSTTKDGYNLMCFVMRPETEITQVGQSSKAVVLMHDWFSNSEEFFAADGPSLTGMLTAAGYNVFLPNGRGSEYSRTSSTSNWTQSDFWNFGPELLVYDSTAAIQTAMESTGAKKVNMMCVGMSCMTIAMLGALNPTWCSLYIKSITMIAPVVFMNNVKPKCFSHIANDCGFWCSWQTICDRMGPNQFTLTAPWLSSMEVPCTSATCKSCPVSALYTDDATYASQLDQDYKSSREYASSSACTTKYTMMHLSEICYYGELQRYDFGYTVNMQSYGQSTPPNYDLTLIKTPVRIYAAQNDKMSQSSDIFTLQSSLPNCITTYTAFPTRMHMFGWTNFAEREKLYRTMISSMP